MTFLGILENIIADIALIVAGLLIGWLWILISRRGALNSFFGTRTPKRMVIYLSNIRVKVFGAIGLDGRKMSYQGSTIAHGEMIAANRIRSLFSFLFPAATERPDFLSKILLSDVTVQINLCPLDEESLDSEATLIALGTPAFNTASLFIQKSNSLGVSFRLGVLKESDLAKIPPKNVLPVSMSTDAEVHFIPGGTAQYPPSSSPSRASSSEEKEELPSAILINDIPPISKTTHGFVQRGFEPDSGRMLFFVAGLSELATAGAAHYLASHWRTLYRKYRASKSFIVMLNIESSDYRKQSIVFERELDTA